MDKRAASEFDNSYCEQGFESLVDLFSLISITLILATVVYGFKSNLVLETEKTSIKTVIDSSGSSDVSMENMFIIYVTNEDGQNVLIFNDSDRGHRVVPVSRKIIDDVMGGEYSYLNNAKEIALMVDMSGTDTTQAIFADVQRWMATNEMGDKVSIGFSR